MPSYRAPVDDVLFLLYDVLGFERYSNLPGFSAASRDVVEAVLNEGGKLAGGVFAPLNLSGDVEGCRRSPDGRVATPKGFKAAYDAHAEGGWTGLSVPEEFGGQGLPRVLNAAISEFFSGANLALTMYPGLTQGAIAALLVHGNEEQKATFIPNMVSGTWSGTMNLTEPHCGTDLGLLKTKAVPNSDSSYSLTGTKIFISAGEHDLAENIIHLVIARIEGAPLGTKGISLFVVPKFLVNEDGSLGPANGVSCGSIEHKMGIHGNATCVMNYDGAKGWLVGEAHRGLNAMFVMMNEARLAVGLQGLSQSEAAYQNALAYAKDRLQGRSLTGPKAPDKPADPIIVHPDVRRTLLQIRAFNEAARALVLWIGLQADIAHSSQDQKQVQLAEDLLGLMTPVVKGVLTDRGFSNAVEAQQLLGGHGYIEEWGLSQFVRDARITMIYEGANGVQAMDLIGRKLPRDGGRAIMSIFGEIQGFLKDNAADEALKPFTSPVKAALDDLQAATMWLMQNAMAKPDHAGAGASDFMHLLGLTAMGYLWGRIAKAALAAKQAGNDAARMEAKLVAGRFFMERMLPETGLRLARIKAGADSTMALPAEAF